MKREGKNRGRGRGKGRGKGRQKEDKERRERTVFDLTICALCYLISSLLFAWLYFIFLSIIRYAHRRKSTGLGLGRFGSDFGTSFGSFNNLT